MAGGLIQLRALSFIGPDKEPAMVEFGPGLNIIEGASSTGKSFITESINYMLGGGDELRPFEERAGYDRVRLVLNVVGGAYWTLERSVELGHYRLIEGINATAEFPVDAQMLKVKHDQNVSDNLSAFLLEIIGLRGKKLRKNAEGKTQSLSFRNLISFIIVDEVSIYKQTSPILTGHRTSSTAEYALFKLLLTGVDDSSLVYIPEKVVEGSKAKIQLLNEMLDERLIQVKEIDRTDLLSQLEKISAKIKTIKEKIIEVEEELEVSRTNRLKNWQERQRLQDRIDEIGGLISRFDLLNKQYDADLARLVAIEESGTIFATMGTGSCPLCGAEPEHQSHKEDCDLDVSEIVIAASGERDKILHLKRELEQTVYGLLAEMGNKKEAAKQLTSALEEIDKEISHTLSPARAKVSEEFAKLVELRESIQRNFDLFKTIDELEARKSSLEETASHGNGTQPTTTAILDSVLHVFSQVVEDILSRWDYPNAKAVYFNVSSRVRDIVINGKARGSEGKGLRALSCAAFLVGIMRYCKEAQLAHPGFVVLDSPLVAYKEPDGKDDDLSGTDVKDRFYRDLAVNYKERQVIVLENETPPQDIIDQINYISFTKNPNKGRYGFFPHIP